MPTTVPETGPSVRGRIEAMMRAYRGPDAVAVLPGLLGRRVTLRHRVQGQRVQDQRVQDQQVQDQRVQDQRVHGEDALTDAVGELVGAGPGAVLVRTHAGPVWVRTEDVVAVREIPPTRPRRASWSAVARLERLCADGWPAPVDQPLGQWRLRAAAGFTGRANSALAVGDPGLPMAGALAEVRAFAAEHGLPPRLQVPEGSPWQSAALAHGWTPEHQHPAGWRVEVLVGPSADTGTAGDVTAGNVAAVTVEGREQWRVVAGEPITGAVGVAREHVLTAPALAHVGFGLARIGAATVGTVRLAVVDEHLYVTRLWVHAGHRRSGVATALMAAAGAWSTERGARWSVLQVAAHNAAALAFYRRLGFTPHHRYRYLRPPKSAPIAPDRADFAP